jgi:ubiquinol-cytochrome c reductase cytochrome b subunit
MRAAAIAALSLLLACAGPSAVPQHPHFAADVLPVLNANCAGCHGATAPDGNYSVTSHAGVLGVGTDSTPNVTTGQPDSSLIYQRITGAATPQMPLGGVPLDTVESGTVRNWIADGAQDN